MNKTLAVIFSLGFALATGGASAESIIASGTGLASPTTTLDFSEVAVADNTALTNQFAGFGLTFSDFFYNGCPRCTVTPPSGVKPDIGNFANSVFSPFSPLVSISFTSVLDGAAWQWAANPHASYTFSAFLSNTLVEQFTVEINGSSGWGYYGFTGISFDRIEIKAGQAFLIDNLQIAAVPEPEIYAMLGVGLGLLGWVGRRKKLRETAAA